MLVAVDVFEKLVPKSEGQKKLKEALTDDSKVIVGVFGPTGTGKSLFTLLYGVSGLLSGRYQRLVLARPVIDVVTGKEVTLADAGEEWYELFRGYLKDILAPHLEWPLIEDLIAEGRILLVDTHYLRGRTFDHALVVLDDVQNTRPEVVVETIVRIGERSRLVIIGDPVLQRLTMEADGAPELAREILLGEGEGVAIVDLGLKDIVRPGARRGVRLLFELHMRKRSLDALEERALETARRVAPDAEVITAVSLVDLKKKWGIESQHVPDVLLVVKKGYLARMIGQGGQRIGSVEEETGVSVRAVEFDLDFTELIRAVHPVPWVYKHIVDSDIAGPRLHVKVLKEAFGAFVGQRGLHIRFLEDFMQKLLGVGVWASDVEPPKKAGKKRKRKK